MAMLRVGVLPPVAGSATQPVIDAVGLVLSRQIDFSVGDTSPRNLPCELVLGSSFL